MIGFAIYHGLAYYYLKTNQTKDVLPTIEKISQYVSCAIYVVLALVFWSSYSIPILCFAIFEHLAMSMLPLPKTWPAFELVRIDAENKGWEIDESGYVLWMKKKEKSEDEPKQSQVSTT